MIIADDEKMLIQLVRKLGHFEQLGIEIIDECYDGESALEFIRCIREQCEKENIILAPLREIV